MDVIDPRDYQGIDATIKNVARSVQNQLAMFMISYQEVLLFIKDLKTKKIITERIQSLENDDGYIDFIRDVREDPNFKNVNWVNLLQSMKNDMIPFGHETTAFYDKMDNEQILKSKDAKELINRYLNAFIKNLTTYEIEKSHFTQRDRSDKIKIIKNIFSNFLPMDIIGQFEQIINDMQDPSFDPKPEPEAVTNDTAEPSDEEPADNQSGDTDTAGDDSSAQSQQDADPNYDNDKILKAIEPLVKQFRGLEETKSIFEESSDLKTQAKNAFERWTNSLLTTKFVELFKFIKRFEKELEKIEKANLNPDPEKIKAYKWMQHVMGKTTEGETLNGVKSDDFKTFYNAFKKYNKELQDRYNEFKRTKPKLDDPSTITEGRIKRENILKEMRIKIKESARSQQLAQGPLSGALVAKLTALDDEFIDYYRRFLIIYNKLRDMPTDYNFTNLEDEMLIDFMNNMLAQLLLPLQEYESLEKPISWPEVMVGYEKLFLTVQNLFALDDNFDERKAIQLIEKFKREYQAFLHDVFNMAKSSKVRGQTLKLSELKSLIKQELKVLNGKKMVRN